MPDLSTLTFAAPAVLAAFAILPAIWLILRATPPRPQKAAFPAFRLLLGLADRERTPARTPPLLLIIRLLIASLAILGLAGPALNAPTAGEADARPLMVVVDDAWTAAANWRLRRNALQSIAEEARRGQRAAYLITTSPDAAGSADAPELLDAEAFAAAAAGLQPGPLLPDQAAAAGRISAAPRRGDGYDIRWLSDGVAHDGRNALADAMTDAGSVTTLIDADASILHIGGRRAANGADVFDIRRARAATAWRGELIVSARDGRGLARAPVVLEAGEREATAQIDLPIALRNEIAAARIDGTASAGALLLADRRSRRALVGIVGARTSGGVDLLEGASYIQAALGPYADFFAGAIAELTSSDADVIVLDDVGRLRAEDEAALREWAATGGVILRFAGPNLAEAAQDGDVPLLPVRLRGGGRAFGGALTWETPQPIDGFSQSGPFADIATPTDALIRRQILAAPGGETTERTWARLGDQTPLVTGERIGEGALVLFHVTATPDWSDLPLSGAFVEMLRRIAFLSAVRSQTDDGRDDSAERFAAARLVDGFGALRPPAANAPSVTLAEADAGPSIAAPPGLYGRLDAPVAINAVAPNLELQPLTDIPGRRAPYADAPPRRFAAPLFLMALVLVGLDAIASLYFSGGLNFRRRAARATSASGIAAIIAFSFILGQMAAGEARAQAADSGNAIAANEPDAPYDAPIDPKTFEAAIATRLGFVATGDERADSLSYYGLSALSNELYRRTAVEPADPQPVDLEADDLSVYPLLYWPIVAGMAPPSDIALANLELFMRFGGLVIMDTRDDERAIGDAVTPERRILRDILFRLDAPPLRPVPQEHVLLRSFYLISDLDGRAGEGTVWVAAPDAENDGVTSILIGGRDWAGAWARDDSRSPLRPMPNLAAGQGCAVRPGVPPRECAYRAGINMALVALTGNYKSDQVHTPILLQRLGRQ
ncbi:MAG: DUF4159 domain-containing protein [Alphaproteobacteria bacterium]|nr:DUF4159 domain-containing protein [Alphaproteobacteria bacterium]